MEKYSRMLVVLHIITLHLYGRVWCDSPDSHNSSKYSIKMGREEYSPLQTPSSTSIVVREETDDLLGEVDLTTLHKDLQLLGRFMRIAYNGINAAGEKYTNLLIEVQTLGYDIVDLCMKTGRTLNRFKVRSKAAVRTLQAAFMYVLDGHEEVAVKLYAELVDTAKDMQKSSLELSEEFIKTKEKVVETLEHTQIQKGEQATRMRELQVERVKMEETKTEQQRLIDEAKVRERKARRQQKRLQLLENDAVKRLTSNHDYGRRFINYASNFFGYGDVFSDSAFTENVADLFHKWRLEQLQLEEKDRNLRYSALSELKKVAIKMADIDSMFESEESIAEAVVDSLHESAGALKELSVVMIRAADFWKRLEDHYETLTTLPMPISGSSVDFGADKRLAIWTSRPSMEEMIRTIAHWISLQNVCKDLMEQIKITKTELFEFIGENPTKQESRIIIKSLSSEFLKEANIEQNRLLESGSNAQSEMAELSRKISDPKAEDKKGHDEF